ncbi:MAG: DUF4339 domain-containing protein [Ginsengibacter sp.]
MDKKYFLSDGVNQSGPFTFEEISKLFLKKDTKVWVEGAENWKNISEFEELKPLIIIMPPPIPKDENKSKNLAKEIKINFKLLLISLILAICSYPIIAFVKGGFKSLSYKSKIENLYKEYDEPTETADTSITEPKADFINKRNDLIREVQAFISSDDLAQTEMPDYRNYNSQMGIYNTYEAFDYSTSLENNIKRSFGNDTIFLSFIIFILISCTLIVGRHLIKFFDRSIHWVRTNSKN